ncbi:MAG: MraY family glycosyltransferase [Candidatus Omnitrophica bacterium]|nr:MraY family glycosyltransferase [Candidatus Omnitrophota bacterium]
MIFSSVILFAAAFVLCSVLVPWFERFGRSRGYVTGHAPQKIDARNIPYFGGVAMFLGVLTISLAGLRVFPLEVKPINFFLFLSASGIVVVFGLYDDLRELSPVKKLIGQTLAALVMVAGGVRTEIIYISGWGNIFLSLLWIVVMANALNLMDILDGLAGGVSIITISTFFLFALVTGNHFVLLVAAVLGGAVTAFLRYNLPPARIFMGDAGSQFLGFAQAVMAISLSLAPSGHEIGLVIPLVILAVPIFDLFFVIMMRLKQKRSIFVKSNDHFVFRMLKSGLSNATIVFAMVAVTIISCLCSALIYRFSNNAGMVLFSALIGFLFLYGLKLGKLEIKQ